MDVNNKLFFCYGNKNKLYDAFISLAIIILYLCYFTIPISLLTNNNFFVQNYYNNHSTFITKNKNTTHYVSYLYAGAMFARQVDAAENMQRYLKEYYKNTVLNLTNNNNDNSGINYKYDAYGKILNKTKYNLNYIFNPFSYNGERFDQHTNLQYLRTRFYNSNIKHFLQQDNYNLLNKSGFVDANPISNIDPTGHMSNTAQDLLFGLGIATTSAAMLLCAGNIAGVAVGVLLNSAIGIKDMANGAYFDGAAAILGAATFALGIPSTNPEFYFSKEYIASKGKDAEEKLMRLWGRISNGTGGLQLGLNNARSSKNDEVNWYKIGFACVVGVGAGLIAGDRYAAMTHKMRVALKDKQFFNETPESMITAAESTECVGSPLKAPPPLPTVRNIASFFVKMSLIGGIRSVVKEAIRSSIVNLSFGIYYSATAGNFNKDNVLGHLLSDVSVGFVSGLISGAASEPNRAKYWRDTDPALTAFIFYRSARDLMFSDTEHVLHGVFENIIPAWN